MSVTKDSSNIFYFPAADRLTTSNWARWKKNITFVIRVRGLIDHIDGSITRPVPPASQAEMDKWDKDDTIVLANLALNVEDLQAFGERADEGTALQLWKILLTRFEKTDKVSQTVLTDMLRRTKLAEGMDGMETHLAELNKKRAAANAAGANIDDTDFCLIIIQSLPVSWNQITLLLFDIADPIVLAARLLSFEMHLASQRTNSSINTSSTPSSYYTQSGKERPSCTNCKKLGHVSETCYAKGGGKEGQWPSHWRKRGDKAASTSVANTATATTPTSTALTPTTAAAAMFTISDRFSLFMAVDTTTTMQPTNTFIDSGASNHYFVDKSWFSEYAAITPRKGKAAKLGSAFEIIGVGTVLAQTIVNGTIQPIALVNVLHAPELSANLISVAAADKSGMGISGRAGEIRILDKDNMPILIGHIESSTSLYSVKLDKLDTGLFPSPPVTFLSVDPRALAASSSLSKTSIETWHRRLAHFNESAVRTLHRDEGVVGMEVTKDGCDGHCVDCLKGKQSRGRFHKVERESHVLDRVFIDLMGPMRLPTLNGELYVVTADDGCTSWHHVGLLKGKTATESLEWFKWFQMMSERQTGTKLKRIRTDNGTEFCNKEWAAYLQQQGIIHEKTTPYTPQQDGLGERGHRSLANAARSMMIAAGAPDHLWGEAFKTAAYVLNLCPSRRQNNKTPYESWYGRKPNIAHLRVWGSKVFAKVPDERRRKLDEKSVEGIHVGYTEDANYLIYIPDGMGRIFRSRDVVFDELRPHRSSPAENLAPTIQAIEWAPDDDAPLEPVPEAQHHQTTPNQPSTPIPEPVPAPKPVKQRSRIPKLLAMPTRRSTRIHNSSSAMKESRESNRREAAAQEEGLEWAMIVEDEEPYFADDLGERERESEEREDGMKYLESLSPTAKDTVVDTEMLYLVPPTVTPKTYKEAIRSGEHWKAPMKSEYEELVEMGAWELVPREPGMNVIGSKWAFAVKFRSDGTVDRYKARLVAQGFFQIPGIDFLETQTHSAVIRFESIRALCAVAAAMDLEFDQIDITKAYLNATLSDDVYMTQPEGFVSPENPTHVCKLIKALYGTMQAGYEWWKEFDNTYTDLGFRRSRADECVRIRSDGNDTTITGTYTDDVGIVSTSRGGVERVKKELGEKYGVKDEGPISHMLGIKVERDRTKRTLTISQRAYAERVLERAGMTDCNPTRTPLPPGLRLGRKDSPVNEAERKEMEGKPYAELLGAIMYMAWGTRPDLAYPVQLLARSMADPGLAHWHALRHVLKYIKGTLDFSITYDGHHSEGLTPVAYSDSSLGDCGDTGRSTQGFVVTMGGGPVSWSSKRQESTSQSTAEAEYIALVHAGKTMVWLKNFLDELNIKTNPTLTIRGDNKGAVAIASKTINYGRARHIKLAHFWLREKIRAKELRVIHIPGAENPADIMTKAVSGEVNARHVRRLGMAV